MKVIYIGWHGLVAHAPVDLGNGRARPRCGAGGGRTFAWDLMLDVDPAATDLCLRCWPHGTGDGVDAEGAHDECT